MKLVKITGMSESDIDTLLNWTPNIMIGDNGEILVLESEWSVIDQNDFEDDFMYSYVDV